MDRPMNSQRALSRIQQSQEEERHPRQEYLCEQWIRGEAESDLWALGSGGGGWCPTAVNLRGPGP